MIADVLVILSVLLMVAAAVLYIRKEKKRGVTCIGCPHAAECAKRKQGGCDSDTGSK